MTRRNRNIDDGPLQGLYRDREQAWIFGVCAGLADRFNFQASMVRVIAIVSLAMFFWWTAAIYIGATLLIREKPLVYSGSRSEYEFWRRNRHHNWSDI
jgi:phage shock protein PspC (stress-responsive transcriptional regulator)